MDRLSVIWLICSIAAFIGILYNFFAMRRDKREAEMGR